MTQMFSSVPQAARRSLVAALFGFVLAAAGGVISQPAQAQALPEFADLAERVGPAVVNIRTTERRAARSSGGPEIDEDMLEFFKRFGIPIPNQPTPRGQRPAPDGAGRCHVFPPQKQNICFKIHIYIWDFCGKIK
mgnify:CR=1 FL=1